MISQDNFCICHDVGIYEPTNPVLVTLQKIKSGEIVLSTSKHCLAIQPAEKKFKNVNSSAAGQKHLSPC
jgi:hypothetical protein